MSFTTWVDERIANALSDKRIKLVVDEAVDRIKADLFADVDKRLDKLEGDLHKKLDNIEGVIGDTINREIGAVTGDLKNDIGRVFGVVQGLPPQITDLPGQIIAGVEGIINRFNPFHLG